MARKAQTTQALATLSEENYLALKDFDLGATLAEEMDGLNAFFERIKMPSGDTLVFQLPSENPEEPEIKKEFTAVILYHHPIRAYFKGKYDGTVNTCPLLNGDIHSYGGEYFFGKNSYALVIRIMGSGAVDDKGIKFLVPDRGLTEQVSEFPLGIGVVPCQPVYELL